MQLGRENRGSAELCEASGDQTCPTRPDDSLIGLQRALLRMPSDSLLPGQPVPLPRGPALKPGSGTYTRSGEIRASLFGTPLHQGSVGHSSLNT